MSSKIKQKDIDAGTAVNGQVLTYNSASGEWEPQTNASTDSMQVSYDGGATVAMPDNGSNPVAFDTVTPDLAGFGLFAVARNIGGGERTVLVGPSQPVNVAFDGTNLTLNSGYGSDQTTNDTAVSGTDAGEIDLTCGQGGDGSTSTGAALAGFGGSGGEIEGGGGSGGQGGAGSALVAGRGGGDGGGICWSIGSGGVGGASGGFAGGAGDGGDAGEYGLDGASGGTGGAGTAGSPAGDGGLGSGIGITAGNGGNAGADNGGAGGAGGVGGQIALLAGNGGTSTNGGANGTPGNISAQLDVENGGSFFVDDSNTPHEFTRPGDGSFIPLLNVQRARGDVTVFTALQAPNEPDDGTFNGTTLLLVSGNGSTQTTADTGLAGTQSGAVALIVPSGGDGSDSSGTANGGDGGSSGTMNISTGRGGDGGNGSGAFTAGAGGAGGETTITLGNGGDGGNGTASVVGRPGGNGGALTMADGDGGDGGDGTGTTAAGAGGMGATVQLHGGDAGNAGAANGGAGANGGTGGSVSILAGQGGSATGAGVAGTPGSISLAYFSGGAINLGTGVAGTINSGFSGTPWIHDGYYTIRDMAAPGAPASTLRGNLFKKSGDDGLFWHPNGGAEVDLTGGGTAPAADTILDFTDTTTNATIRTLANYITLADERAIDLKIRVWAREPATDDTAQYVINAIANRATGGLVTIKNEHVVTTFEDAGTSWVVSLDIDTSDIRVRITGEAAKTIEWRCTMEVSEHG